MYVGKIVIIRGKKLTYFGEMLDENELWDQERDGEHTGGLSTECKWPHAILTEKKN